jgi:NADH-quinone oxidoreductase subunit E
MSEKSAKLLSQLISPEGVKDIDNWIKKYPADEKQSAVMSALRIVQDEHGYLSPQLMDAVADYLDMPAIAVYEVASFYTMYEKKPIGRNLINVCTNVSCKLRGSADVVDYLKQTLGVELGGTTEDNCFTLRAVECLGACVNAPMMQVNRDYHENLTYEKIDQVLEQYK